MDVTNGCTDRWMDRWNTRLMDNPRTRCLHQPFWPGTGIVEQKFLQTTYVRYYMYCMYTLIYKEHTTEMKHHRWSTANVPALTLCNPSSTARLPSSAAVTSGDSLHAVSPYDVVTRCCSRSRDVMSCVIKQYHNKACDSHSTLLVKKINDKLYK